MYGGGQGESQHSHCARSDRTIPKVVAVAVAVKFRRWPKFRAESEYALGPAVRVEQPLRKLAVEVFFSEVGPFRDADGHLIHGNATYASEDRIRSS
jgi:hypothetical protein